MPRLETVHPVLMSRDVATSIRFYQRLGFSLTFQDHPVDPRYAAVARDGVELHLQWQGEAQWAHPIDRPTYRLVVQDVDGLYAELHNAGALAERVPGCSPWLTPGDTPWGTREFHVRDPDGNGLQFYRAVSWRTPERSRLQIAQAETADDIATVRTLFHEYQRLLGVDLCFQDFEAEVDGLPGAYAPPGGRLFLATHDGIPVGCAALRALEPPRCEMKRLFVRPQARGLGVGKALVSRILDEARALGYSEAVLDTLPTMAEAQRLYEQFGFHDIPPYRPNPIAGTRYLAKSLRGA